MANWACRARWPPTPARTWATRATTRLRRRHAGVQGLVDSVDFPKFVADLLKAVFDANLKVMKQQTDTYIKLMKEATKCTADFIKKVKDDETFANLAESRGDQYNVTTEKGADGSTKLALTNPEGDKVDPEDTEVKRHILEAKINMAKEHRAALREVLLMGVTRLVVEEGRDRSRRRVQRQGDAREQGAPRDQNINVTSRHGIRLAARRPLRRPERQLSMNNTNIQVNTSDKKATDDLSATLKGKVNIEFKTDYFKLDNFATMYADGGDRGTQASGPGGAGWTGGRRRRGSAARSGGRWCSHGARDSRVTGDDAQRRRLPHRYRDQPLLPAEGRSKGRSGAPASSGSTR